MMLAMPHVRTALLCSFIAMAQPSVAAVPKIGDPPPPASLEITDVEAWASAYLNRESWTLITHDIEGARFIRPNGATPTAPYMVEADVRTELFRPVKMGPGVARSGLAHWSVDCASTRYAVLSMTIFAHNNMQGELAKKISADKTWMIPIESQAATISVICKSGLTVAPPERPLKASPASPS